VQGAAIRHESVTSRNRTAAGWAAGLLLSLALGLGGDYFHVPLAWIVGPLLGTATLAIAGLPVFSSVRARRTGQLIIGTGLGLNITAAVALASLPLLPLMIGCGLVSVLIGATIAIAFAAAARVSYTTAFFAMMPGGLSEMAVLGARAGAEPEPIAVSQSLRLALIVCLFPPLILHFSDVAPGSALRSTTQLDLLHIVEALALGLLGAATLALLRVRNPWILGALLGSALGTSFGLLDGRLHPWLFAAGQFLIGIAIGASFRREIVARLGRLMVLSALGTVTLSLAMIVLAAVVAALFHLDFIATALGVGPGGMTELSIAAQSLGLPVASVIGFHIVRAIIVNGFAETILRLLRRLPVQQRLDAWLAARTRR